MAVDALCIANGGVRMLIPRKEFDRPVAPVTAGSRTLGAEQERLAAAVGADWVVLRTRLPGRSIRRSRWDRRWSGRPLATLRW